MKFVKLTLLLLIMLNLVGCVSSGSIHEASPITATKPFDLDLIFVKTTSSSSDLEAEKQMLNDEIVSGLRDTHLFNAASGIRADLGSGSGITITADVVKIKKISKNKRLWAGALAGRARIRVQVTVSDLNSGQPIETFEADGQSSGGSSLAGTTDEAIERAADIVVGEVLKIYAQTAE
ncbi:MAG: DUF4410 domain-containing protein [Verrucomicrobiota bacterium]|jgi:hypothetical protein